MLYSIKLFISHILYIIGDFISLTTMKWGNGFGYSLYKEAMLWSCELDTKGVIWKPVKPNKSRRKKKK